MVNKDVYYFHRLVFSSQAAQLATAENEWKFFCVPLYDSQLQPLRSTTIICHPTVCTPGFNLPRHLWSTLNRFRTSQGRRAANLVKRCQSPTSLVHRRRRIVIVNHCPSRLQLHGLVVVHGRCIELINTLFHGWACTANVRPTKRHTAKKQNDFIDSIVCLQLVLVAGNRC